MLGLGGSHIGKAALHAREAVRIIRTAIDSGITFMDNSWDYNEGQSEMPHRQGAAGRLPRQKAFVMTKIDGRTKKEATSQFEQSLRRLKVDHIDLLQHHEIIRFEDADRIFAADGAMEALPRSAGRRASSATSASPATKTRACTSTCWRKPGPHGFHFDTVQMPLNVMDAHFRSFEKQVLPVLVKRGHRRPRHEEHGQMRILLKSKAVTPMECLHYALNLPTSVVITGIDSMEILQQALHAATHVPALAREDQITEPSGKDARAPPPKDEFELFKTTPYFDSTAQNPEWLGEEPARVKTLTA